MGSWRFVVTAAGLVLSLAAGCGGAGANVETRAANDDATARLARFQTVEDEVLRTLAAIDRRVARRARLDPREEDLRHLTMGAMLAEDASLAVVDGAIDPFSFEARARGLAAVKVTLASAPADLPDGGAGGFSAPALEKELLGRLVDEEVVRLDEERALPRSASALIRAVVETWRSPASQEHAAERDRWLSRRLREVNASVSGTSAGAGPLDVVRARELDDALDALEHAAESSGLVRSTAELVRLRELLESLATKPAAAAASDWSAVARRLETHLGTKLAPEALERRLDAAERILRAAATRATDEARLDPDALPRMQVLSSSREEHAPWRSRGRACGRCLPRQSGPWRVASGKTQPPPRTMARARTRSSRCTITWSSPNGRSTWRAARRRSRRPPASIGRSRVPVPTWLRAGSGLRSRDLRRRSAEGSQPRCFTAPATRAHVRARGPSSARSRWTSPSECWPRRLRSDGQPGFDGETARILERETSASFSSTIMSAMRYVGVPVLLLRSAISRIVS